MSEEKHIWGIHSRDDSLFLRENIIAIGWKSMGDLRQIDNSREAFKEKYRETYPEAPKQAIANGAGMLYRFIYEVQVGDYIVYPSKNDRTINLGIVEGAYEFSSSDIEYVQQRAVKWIKKLPRTFFTQGALYEIGSAMTFFSVKNYADEYLDAFNSKTRKSIIDNADDDESVAATAEDIIESTKDFILKELSRKLKGYDLEEFVADLLRAMGYRATVSAHGGDRGIDITAYKDELPPRILVQVKSQDGDIKETAIQSLKGAMREGDYGVFITLSSYTKNAKSYLENTPIIKGIDGSQLVDLILKYYDKLNVKYRTMIPLKMVYIPIPNVENGIE